MQVGGVTAAIYVCDYVTGVEALTGPMIVACQWNYMRKRTTSCQYIILFDLTLRDAVSAERKDLRVPCLPRRTERYRNSDRLSRRGGGESYQIIFYRTSRAGGRRVTRDTHKVSISLYKSLLFVIGYVRGTTMSINTPQWRT